jgi:hypothetical protein
LHQLVVKEAESVDEIINKVKVKIDTSSMEKVVEIARTIRVVKKVYHINLCFCAHRNRAGRAGLLYS